MQRGQVNTWWHHTSLFCLVVIMLVSGCASTKQKDVDKNGTDVDMMSMANIPRDMILLVEGKEINHLLEDKDRLKKGIEKFAAKYGDPSKLNIRQLVDEMRKKNKSNAAYKDTKGFTGLGGVMGQETLELAVEAVEAASGDYDPTKGVVVAMKGKITDYEFDGDVGVPGRGKLEVITVVTRESFKGNGRIKLETVGYKWLIKVGEKGFKVVKKDTRNPKDPFPGTMTFSQAMLDRIEDLKFEYKLWAEGTDIVVEKVWRDKKFDWNNPKWKELKKTDEGGKWKRLYDEDPDACIDMMFVAPPPKKYADLPPVPFYCLGRCKSPAIINSR